MCKSRVQGIKTLKTESQSNTTTPDLLNPLPRRATSPVSHHALRFPHLLFSCLFPSNYNVTATSAFWSFVWREPDTGKPLFQV